MKITRIVEGEREETIIQQDPNTARDGWSRDGAPHDFSVFSGYPGVKDDRVGEKEPRNLIVPPPADKKYISIFSKFFGN